MYIRHLIIGYFLLFILCGAAVYVSGPEVLVSIGWYLFIYLLISYLLYVIWKKMHGREIVNLFHFFILFIYRVCSSLFICALIVGAFCYYQNDFRPATLPYYVISNGEKTLRFQTMSHIASSDFYKDVRNNILRAKKADYVLYFEGVRPGSQENTDAFNNTLGINFSPDLYPKLSLLYGIVAQDNNFFLGVENNKDINVDLDIDTIMDLYKEKASTSENQSSKILGHDITETEDLISQSIDSLSERELIVVRYVNQAFMNMIIKNESVRNAILKTLGKEDIFSVILDDRNKHLANEILTSSHEKIFVIYGMMHFDGVYTLLKEADSSWEILSTTEYQVIR